MSDFIAPSYGIPFCIDATDECYYKYVNNEWVRCDTLFELMGFPKNTEVDDLRAQLLSERQRREKAEEALNAYRYHIDAHDNDLKAHGFKDRAEVLWLARELDPYGESHPPSRAALSQSKEEAER